MIKVARLLHASLLVADLGRARAFYEGVLGLSPSPARPEMSFDGVWYDLGEAQIHLLCLSNPDPVEGRPAHGGRDRHTALAVTGWEELKNRLDEGIAYSLSRSGRRALFVRDPDGNALELVDVE
ncbi:MAG: VOC family protein [Betaproteobacteria bacterium]|nr:VOC family protein [Betaproteobacteria bacterium]